MLQSKSIILHVQYKVFELSWLLFRVYLFRKVNFDRVVCLIKYGQTLARALLCKLYLNILDVYSAHIKNSRLLRAEKADTDITKHIFLTLNF